MSDQSFSSEKRTGMQVENQSAVEGTPRVSGSGPQGGSAPTTGYAPVNGLEMYYEIHELAGAVNSQPPLVLLHGSLSATGTSFGLLLPRLVQNRRVIAVEQQAHGRTADINRPLSIEQMAEDTVALLRHLGVQQADLFGYSLGAGIALQIAITQPQMVRKLVLASVTYNRDGFHPGLLEGIQNLQPEMLYGSPFHEEYVNTAPRPDDFPRMIEKIKDLDTRLPDWSEEQVRSIQAPTLLVVGDADIVRPEHAARLITLLGGGVPDNMGVLPRSRLAVLPGTSHISVVYRADWLAPMIEEFLADSDTGEAHG